MYKAIDVFGFHYQTILGFGKICYQFNTILKETSFVNSKMW